VESRRYMPILTDDQKRFLVEEDPTDRVKLQCDNPAHHDAFDIMAINIVTALDSYRVTGEQFAAILMDLMGSFGQIARSHPDGISDLEFRALISQCVHVAALAYRQHREVTGDA